VRRGCEVIVGNATGGRGWVGDEDKVVVCLVVLEASSGVGLHLVNGTLAGFSLDGTKGHNTTDPDWDVIVSCLGAAEGADTVVSAFIVVCSAVR
jgi:hypothetical protein